MGHEADIVLILLLAAEWLLSWRLCSRLVPVAPPVGNRKAPRAADVSIVIPARNEEAVLPGLLGSIASQDQQPREIIVVDDGSEDGTFRAAMEHGVAVVRPGNPEADWRGKTWACQCGAEAASGTFVLFLDADTRFTGGNGFARLLGKYPGGAWSVLPWHETVRHDESFSAFFNLLMALGTVPHGLSGPCLLIPREDYLACGGHGAVKNRILENVHLGAMLERLEVPVGSTTGRGFLSFRMYPSGLRELIAGWTKGFASGAGSTPRGTLVMIACWISALVVSAFAAVISPWFLPIYGAYALRLRLMLRRTGSFAWWSYVLYPVTLGFFLIVFLRALGPAGRKATWKGRSVASDVV